MALNGKANEVDREHDRDSNTKKRRVVWDKELHNKFLKAVDEIGSSKAVPTTILEKMNVGGITRENVASHLQKHRVNLEKEKEKKTIEERNRSLAPPQRGGMYNGGRSNDYNEEVDAISNLISRFSQNSEMVSLFHLLEPVMATTMLPEPSRLHVPSFPSSLTDISSLNQNKKPVLMVDVTRGFNYNNSYSVHEQQQG